MKKAFGFDIDEYIYYGAYPGAATLIHDEERWRDYIVNALAETVLLKDILLNHQINKPALLRQLYALAIQYSGQILSFQKNTRTTSRRRKHHNPRTLLRTTFYGRSRLRTSKIPC